MQGCEEGAEGQGEAQQSLEGSSLQTGCRPICQAEQVSPILRQLNSAAGPCSISHRMCGHHLLFIVTVLAHKKVCLMRVGVCRRQDNLQRRVDKKLDTKKARREKKLMRPGFEGRRDTFIS